MDLGMAKHLMTQVRETLNEEKNMRAVTGRAAICANGNCRKLVQPEDQVKVGRFIYCPEHGLERAISEQLRISENKA
jgi:hypothetical protein